MLYNSLKHLMEDVWHNGDVDIQKWKQLSEWIDDGFKSGLTTGCMENVIVGAIS